MAKTTDHTDLDPTAVAHWKAARGAGIDRELDVVTALWTHELATSTAERLGELARRFGARLAATGISSLTEATSDACDGFIWAPTRRNNAPSISTVHLRRTTLRALFRTLARLDPSITDPSAGLIVPPRDQPRARPVTIGELDLTRTAALGRQRGGLRAAATIALAESTATSGELAVLRWSDLDLDQAGVHLPGAGPVSARFGLLTTWGIGVLRRCETLTGPEPAALVVASSTGGRTPYAAQAAMSNRLTKLIAAAEISDPHVRAGSIRLWGGARALRSGGIEAAARALGFSSLDATAEALGHDWTVQR